MAVGILPGGGHLGVRDNVTAPPTKVVPETDWSSPDSIANLLESTMNNPAALKAISQHFGIDLSGRYPAFEIAKRMLGPEMGILASQFAQRYALQPAINEIQNKQFTMLGDPGLRTGMANAAIDAGTASTTAQLTHRLESQGAGIGALGGAATITANNAASAKNANRAYQFSPQGMIDSSQAQAQIVNQNSPDLSRLGQIQSIMTGTPRNATGLETAMGLGNMAGSLLGGLGAAGGSKGLKGL